MSQSRWAVCLCGCGLCGPQLARRRLVLDGSLRKAAVWEGLPADLPQLRPSGRILFVQHGAGVVPDLVSVANPQPRGAGRRDDVFTVWTPGEMCGVYSLKLGHLRRRSK